MEFATVLSIIVSLIVPLTFASYLVTKIAD
jgi:hypothetical protein